MNSAIQFIKKKIITNNNKFFIYFYSFGVLNGILSSLTFTYAWCYFGIKYGIALSATVFFLLGFFLLKILKKSIGEKQ